MRPDEGPRLTVGSLLGVPLGSTPQRPPTVLPAPPVAGPPARPQPEGAGQGLLEVAFDEVEGRDWTITGGEVGRGGQAAWRPDGIEALTFNNPFGQLIERVWFDGKVVFAVDRGRIDVDPAKVKVAQEYQVVYGAELDEGGRSIGEPERVEGQLNIYDTVPGMDRYSPIWQFNYVVVPRDYQPNTLRSEGDCLASGYPILRSQDFEN